MCDGIRMSDTGEVELEMSKLESRKVLAAILVVLHDHDLSEEAIVELERVKLCLINLGVMENG